MTIQGGEGGQLNEAMMFGNPLLKADSINGCATWPLVRWWVIKI